MESSAKDAALWQLFVRLRRRRFVIGIDDYDALRESLRAGFGLSSREALRSLCCLLWAKSNSEREIVTSLFDQIEFLDWDLSKITPATLSLPQNELDEPSATLSADEGHAPDVIPDPRPPVNADMPATLPRRGLPPISIAADLLPAKPFVFVPHFSLTPREVAQSFRYFRKPSLSGPPEDIDVDETIALRCRQGIIGSVVLKPRKRNTSRLLILVDRQGSMAPFHQLNEMLTDTIADADPSGGFAVYYFHDIPVEGDDGRILSSIREQPFPVLDDVLNQITPLKTGYIYEDSDLLLPVLLTDVLRSFAHGSTVLLLSDAGAARRHYDPRRLLDTVGFIKALRLYTQRHVWLNPLPRTSWEGSTAVQIARHVPMFSIDLEGLNHAATALRG